MDEKLHSVIRPHPPLPFANLRDQNHFKIDPIRIDAIVHSLVRLDPVSVHIAWIGLLRAKASVDENVFNTSRPKRSNCGPQAFQKPTPPRSEPEPASDLFQCCPVITRRQCARGGIESRNHATLIMSGTIYIVNICAVIARTRCSSAPRPSPHLFCRPSCDDESPVEPGPSLHRSTQRSIRAADWVEKLPSIPGLSAAVSTSINASTESSVCRSAFDLLNPVKNRCVVSTVIESANSGRAPTGHVVCQIHRNLPTETGRRVIPRNAPATQIVGNCGLDLLQRQAPDSTSSLRGAHHFPPAGRRAAALSTHNPVPVVSMAAGHSGHMDRIRSSQPSSRSRNFRGRA